MLYILQVIIVCTVLFNVALATQVPAYVVSNQNQKAREGYNDYDSYVSKSKFLIFNDKNDLLHQLYLFRFCFLKDHIVCLKL